MRANFYTLILIANVFLSSYAIQFNVNLTQLAEVDIQVSKVAPTTIFPTLLFTQDFHNLIARYSLLVDSDEKISFWQSIYPKFSINLLSAFDRIGFPQREDNPFSFQLTPSQIHAKFSSISQAYVMVFQRTYYFVNGELHFYKREVLFQQFVSINAVLNIQANGIIAPSQIQTVPPSLQSQYVVATGSVT